MVRTWIDQQDRHHDAFAELLGADEVEQRQQERRIQLRAVEHGCCAGRSSSLPAHRCQPASGTARSAPWGSMMAIWRDDVLPRIMGRTRHAAYLAHTTRSSTTPAARRDNDVGSASLDGLVADTAAEDLRPALPQVRVPTLLTYGDRDVRVPLTVAQQILAAITDSTLVLLPGSGPLCNVEAAHRFSETVRAFLRERR